ncbi:MAG: MBL fold metallo-hydrolase [Gammaproteobacteria bacterium]|nr:MBL fold metallo-hydrolase [Gammaproteobacteria bacterium]
MPTFPRATASHFVCPHAASLPRLKPALIACSMALCWTAASATAAERSVEEVADIYRQAATLAAGTQHLRLRNVVCPASPPLPVTAPFAVVPSEPAPRVVPPLADWYHEPVKVFDQLYFVGTNEHSSWAAVSDEGIMLIDTLYDYATGDAIVGGLRKLGFDPADIELVIISHGHGDHHAGAKYLQDEFGARVVMGADDWDLVERDRRNPIPRRDIIAEDGMSFTMGNTTVTLHATPGHTDGTMSSIITVQDNGVEHVAALWGGTSITERTTTDNVQLYIDSAVRFSNIVQSAAADILLANHLIFDGSMDKIPLLATRQAGDPHPYVVGTQTILDYLSVAENCARAVMAYR